MKKSKSQKYQSNIDLIYSINSIFDSDIKKPNEINNNSRVKFISSYSTRNNIGKNNNSNIKKLNKIKNEMVSKLNIFLITDISGIDEETVIFLFKVLFFEFLLSFEFSSSSSIFFSFPT